MQEADLLELRAFIQRHRQATLAVAEHDEPFTAMVSYAQEPGLRGFLVHLSNLAPHKRQLLANPRCSLLISAPDPGTGEVLSLPRVTLQGSAARIPKDTPDYEQAMSCYLAKLPTSSIMFTLADFDLFRITPVSGRYIAGFGRTIPFTGAELVSHRRGAEGAED